jgi:uncharacterized protein YjlB
VLSIAAGTSHRLISRSDDFLVVGTYPPGQSADILRTKATPAMLKQIAIIRPPIRSLAQTGPWPGYEPIKRCVDDG